MPTQQPSRVCASMCGCFHSPDPGVTARWRRGSSRHSRSRRSPQLWLGRRRSEWSTGLKSLLLRLLRLLRGSFARSQGRRQPPLSPAQRVFRDVKQPGWCCAASPPLLSVSLLSVCGSHTASASTRPSSLPLSSSPPSLSLSLSRTDGD